MSASTLQSRGGDYRDQAPPQATFSTASGTPNTRASHSAKITLFGPTIAIRQTPESRAANHSVLETSGRAQGNIPPPQKPSDSLVDRIATASRCVVYSVERRERRRRGNHKRTRLPCGRQSACERA